MEENNTKQTSESAGFSETPLPQASPIENIPPAFVSGTTIPKSAESTAQAVSSRVETAEPESKLYGLGVAQLKSLLVKMLLGCLIAAAIVAVIAVLIGGMTDVVWRSIGTIVVAVLHIGILFGVISTSSLTGSSNARRTTSIVANAAIAIIICSFFTAVLNIWDVFDWSLAGKLYMTYLVALVSLFHYKVLSDSLSTHAKLRPYVYATYAFVVLVALLILGAVYSADAWALLDGFYGRLLAAAAIVDVTLTTVVAVILHLYLQQHPELRAKATHEGSPWRTVLIVLAAVLFGGPIILWLVIQLMISSWR